MEKANKSNNYHYNPKLKELAKANRKSMTKSAIAMWNIIKAGNIFGYKFKRERPILNYIADFSCFDLMLVIEVDGLSHDSEKSILKDAQRDSTLQSVGFTVLRFDALYVLNNPDDVVKDIVFWIEEHGFDVEAKA